MHVKKLLDLAPLKLSNGSDYTKQITRQSHTSQIKNLNGQAFHCLKKTSVENCPFHSIIKAKWSKLKDTVGMVRVHTGIQYITSIIFVGSYKNHQVIEAIEKENSSG